MPVVGLLVRSRSSRMSSPRPFSNRLDRFLRRVEDCDLVKNLPNDRPQLSEGGEVREHPVADPTLGQQIQPARIAEESSRPSGPQHLAEFCRFPAVGPASTTLV